MHCEIKGSLFFFFPEFSNGLYLKKQNFYKLCRAEATPICSLYSTLKTPVSHKAPDTIRCRVIL